MTVLDLPFWQVWMGAAFLILGVHFERGSVEQVPKKGKCDFECKYLDEVGECEPCGGMCITDMCPNYLECESCGRSEECEE